MNQPTNKQLTANKQQQSNQPTATTATANS
jgi:hypothetical protein